MSVAIMDSENTIYVVARYLKNEPIVHQNKRLMDMTIICPSACFSAFLTVCSCYLSMRKGM